MALPVSLVRQFRRVLWTTVAWLSPTVVVFAATAPISNYSDLIRVINNVSKWLYGILLALAALFVILAAYRFLNAAGDPKALETAKRQILYAIIAVVVAMLSKTLIGLVSSFF